MQEMQFVQNYEMKSALTFDIFLFGDPGRFPPPWFNILVIILTQYDADYDDDMDGVNNDNDDHNDISKTILLATPKAIVLVSKVFDDDDLDGFNNDNNDNDDNYDMMI